MPEPRFSFFSDTRGICRSLVHIGGDPCVSIISLQKLLKNLSTLIRQIFDDRQFRLGMLAQAVGQVGNLRRVGNPPESLVNRPTSAG
jgi:hypothetical protein